MLQDGALVNAHGIKARNLDFHLVEALDQAGHLILNIAKSVAGHVAGSVQLHLHLVEAFADLFQRARTRAAAAAQLGNLPYELQQLAMHGLNLVVVQAALQVVDAFFELSELTLQSCREFRLAARRRDLGMPARFLNLGATPSFRRFSNSARLGKLGLAHGLHLLHFTSPLLGGGGGAALRLLRFRLTPCLGKFGVPARFSHFGLPFRFRQLRQPPDLGHLVAPALLGRLRLAPRRGDLRRDLRQPPFFLLGRILRLAADELRFATRFLGAQPRLFRIPTGTFRIASGSGSRLELTRLVSSVERGTARLLRLGETPNSASCALRSASVGTEALVRGGLNAGDGAAEAAEEGDARCCRRRPKASRRASSRSKL